MEPATNKDKFHHADPMVCSGRSPEPSLLFEHFPKSKEGMKRFLNGNLADLTTELLPDFVTTKMLVDKWMCRATRARTWDSGVTASRSITASQHHSITASWDGEEQGFILGG
jgi:hypothetical protein